MGTKVAYIEETPKIGRHLRISACNVEDVPFYLSGIDGPPSASQDGKRGLLAAL